VRQPDPQPRGTGPKQCHFEMAEAVLHITLRLLRSISSPALANIGGPERSWAIIGELLRPVPTATTALPPYDYGYPYSSPTPDLYCAGCIVLLVEALERRFSAVSVLMSRDKRAAQNEPGSYSHTHCLRSLFGRIVRGGSSCRRTRINGRLWPDGDFLQSLLLCRLPGIERARCAQSEPGPDISDRVNKSHCAQTTKKLLLREYLSRRQLYTFRLPA
jgi:hypothetical protein